MSKSAPRTRTWRVCFDDPDESSRSRATTWSRVPAVTAQVSGVSRGGKVS
ncbi:hypothetical protein OH797_39525 (plasmid) [Streptomyces anulatus]